MPAEGRENPLLKKGNSDAFFREKYLTKNSGSDGDLPKRQVQAGFQPRHAAVSQRTPAGFYAGGHQSRNDTGVS